MDVFTPSVSLCHDGSIGCHCFHTDCTDQSSISLCHWSKWMFSPRVCHCVMMAVLAVTVFTQIAQISPAFHFATGRNGCFHPECVTVSPWQYWLSLFSHRLHRSVQHFTLPLVEMDVFTPSVSLCHHGSIGCHCFHTDCTDLSSISLCHWLKWMFSPRVCHCVTMAVLAVTVFTQIAQICPAFHFASLNGCFHPECVTVSPWQYWLSLFSHRLHRSDQLLWYHSCDILCNVLQMSRKPDRGFIVLLFT